ncbi:hypothetical protein ES332_D08G162000v1 [Gossypium tomentosum]|uniref:Uncharacterized protein n=1 Tax=Gossypium tomentosum TaxID=34277 RepID=A0A5D2JUP1_GOSTO|nr:hypothetical protein ES332_D08G162000v1 [Gossypium tomentosum]
MERVGSHAGCWRRFNIGTPNHTVPIGTKEGFDGSFNQIRSYGGQLEACGGATCVKRQGRVGGADMCVGVGC